MAKASFLLQAVTDKNHSKALESILSKQAETLLISVAFAKTPGVKVISEFLKTNAKSSKVFVGIRNDITSYQAIEMLLDTGAAIFAVDTGSKSTIFHPKIYLTKNGMEAVAIIGSANLTFGGLHNNIESSSILTLDLANQDDADFYDEAISQFNGMINNYPEHVFQIKNSEVIKTLFESGRLTDETVVITKSSANKKGGTDSTPRMKLFRTFPTSTIKKKIADKFVDEFVINKQGEEVITESPALAAPSIDEFYLVWQSNELKERDLNIPTGENTNPTGSMYWKKGALDNIDQRHHFRDTVFENVLWVKDAKLPHYERAIVNFHIYTKGEFQGIFPLKISHNNDTDSQTYKQKNSMTNVSWGEAKALIAKRDLLGRVLSLSRKDTTPPEFMISID